MIEIPLSKRGWLSVIGTILLLPILGGFLSAFGEDLYQVSRSMVVDPQFQYTLLVIAILIGVGITIGVAFTIYDIHKERNKLRKGADHPTFSGIETNPDKIDQASKRKKEDDWRFFPSNIK